MLVVGTSAFVSLAVGDVLETVVEEYEIVTGVHVPTLPDGTGVSFAKYAWRKGDMSLANAAARLTVDEEIIETARLSVGAVGPTPLRPEELEAALKSAAEETDRVVQLAEDLLVIARSDQGLAGGDDRGGSDRERGKIVQRRQAVGPSQLFSVAEESPSEASQTTSTLPSDPMFPTVAFVPADISLSPVPLKL
jgi:predicted nucleic acid-binding protein